MIHNFNDSLQRSHAASDHPMWLECYKQFFPDMVTMIDHRQDGDHQRNGIDRSIIMQNSKQILIDEKVRDKNYKDIFLEYISVDTTKAPGWVCKPLMCDYIAYAILPRGRAYLLPVISLQRAWKALGKTWIEKYGAKPVPNEGYVTWGCPVPFEPLFSALQRAQEARFKPILN